MQDSLRRRGRSTLSRLGVLPLALVACLACGGDDDDSGDGSGGGGGGATDCAALCAKDRCPADGDNATCMMECQMGAQACPNESAALSACSLARPDTDWICDEFDETVLVEGACEAEANAFFQCAFAGFAF